MKNMVSFRKWYSHGLMSSISVVFCLLVTCSLAQNIPPTPCPDLFQYSFDGTEWIGVLKLTGLGLGQVIRTYMSLSLQARLPNSYPGSLELYLSRKETLNNVIRKQPVLYRIRFPSQQSLPQVMQILLNNQVICSGPTDFNPSATTIKLEHTLYTQLSGQPLASQGPDSMYQLYIPDTNNNPTTIDIQSNNNFQFDDKNTFIPVFDNTSKRPNIQNTFEIPQNPGLAPSKIRPNRPIQSQTQGNQIPLNFESVPNQRPSARPTQSFQPTNTPPEESQQPTPQKRPPTRRKPPTHQIVSDETSETASQSDTLEAMNKVCGVTDSKFNVKPLVVGGSEIKRGSWPWLASIHLNLPTSLSFQCGGSLISHRLVLSSAHCFYVNNKKYTSNDVIVFLGRHNIRSYNEKGSVSSTVDGVYTHPDYKNNQQTFDADIAIILLKNQIRFTEIIRPICLWPEPSTTEDIEGDVGVVVGWGRDETGQTVSTVPKRVEATVVSDLVCIRSNEEFRIITSNRTFCAGNRDGSGPCTGDSGGGLVIYRNYKFWIRGTVSAALSHANKASCNLDEYVIYTDVSKFLDWIYSFMLF